MLTLYSMPSSGNSYKVRLLLAFLGTPYDHIGGEYGSGLTDSDAFRALNPAGKLPLLNPTCKPGCVCCCSMERSLFALTICKTGGTGPAPANDTVRVFFVLRGHDKAPIHTFARFKNTRVPGYTVPL